MAGSTLWQHLKALVDCDKQILEIKQSIEETESVLINNVHLVTQIKASLEEKKARILSRKKNVALQELNANALKIACDEKRARLDMLSNPKEYKALANELLLITREGEEQEELVLKAWHELDRSEKILEAEAKQSVDRIQSLQQESELKQQKNATARLLLEELSSKRDPLLLFVPIEWQARYERMRMTLEEPIVPLLQNSCSACYYSVLQQDIYKLKLSDVVPCRNCYRFLYYDSEVEKKAHEATF